MREPTGGSHREQSSQDADELKGDFVRMDGTHGDTYKIPGDADTVRNAIASSLSIRRCDEGCWQKGHCTGACKDYDVKAEAVAALARLEQTITGLRREQSSLVAAAERTAEVQAHRDECERQLQGWIERAGAAEAQAQRYWERTLAAEAERDAALKERDDYRFWNERVRVCEHHVQDVVAPVGDCLICTADAALGRVEQLETALAKAQA